MKTVVRPRVSTTTGMWALTQMKADVLEFSHLEQANGEIELVMLLLFTIAWKGN